jgi:ABC-type sugar transport system substrate-binding protein
MTAGLEVLPTHFAGSFGTNRESASKQEMMQIMVRSLTRRTGRGAVRRPSRAALKFAIGAVALSTLGAACSSSGSGSSSTSSPASSPTSSASGSASPTSGSSGDAYVSQSQQLLDRAHAAAVTGPSFGTVAPSDIVPWQSSDIPAPTAPPSKPLKVAVAYGIPSGYVPYAAHLIKAIGTKLGWTVSIFPAAATTQSAELAALQQALLTKPNAIISVVIPAVWAGPALAAAKAAGIFTVDIHQDSTDGTGYDAVVPSAEGVQKALLAAWAVAKTGGKSNTMLVDAPGFSDVNVGASQSYLAACSGCTTVTQQFNPTSFVDPTQLESNAKSALSAHTSVNYVIWPTGGLPLTPVLDGIAASPNSGAQLLVDDASPENVQLLRQGKLPMVVEGPGAILVLEAIDNVNRLEQGKPALAETSLRIPISYWTQSQAPAPNFPAITKAQLQANDWLSPFATAWHVPQLESVILGVAS